MQAIAWAGLLATMTPKTHSDTEAVILGKRAAALEAAGQRTDARLVRREEATTHGRAAGMLKGAAAAVASATERDAWLAAGWPVPASQRHPLRLVKAEESEPTLPRRGTAGDQPEDNSCQAHAARETAKRLADSGAFP